MSQTSVLASAGGPKLHSLGAAARALMCHLSLACHPSIHLGRSGLLLKTSGTPPGSMLRVTSALLSRAPRSSPGYPWNPLGPSSFPVLSRSFVISFLQLPIYRPQSHHRHPSIASCYAPTKINTPHPLNSCHPTWSTPAPRTGFSEPTLFYLFIYRSLAVSRPRQPRRRILSWGKVPMFRYIAASDWPHP